MDKHQVCKLPDGERGSIGISGERGGQFGFQISHRTFQISHFFNCDSNMLLIAERMRNAKCEKLNARCEIRNSLPPQVCS